MEMMIAHRNRSKESRGFQRMSGTIIYVNLKLESEMEIWNIPPSSCNRRCTYEVGTNELRE